MDISQFEERKKEHIQIALSPDNQTPSLSDLDRVSLEHNALPELNLEDISLQTQVLGQDLKTPFYINSMTAGHSGAHGLNILMARLCEEQGWMMGVGSQRRELETSKSKEWKELRKQAPQAVILGNIGLPQLIQTPVDRIEALVESLEAQAFFVHLNVLQECIQPEGTPFFKGGVQALESLTQKLSVPVVVKETGCGMSAKTLEQLKNIGLYAVDVSGLGGTHWGRIEGGRAQDFPEKLRCAKTFQNWGISTVQSVLNAIRVEPEYKIWASGGVRSGLDAAKLIGLGARSVGYAQPALVRALQGEGALREWMQTQEYELKVAMLCTGTKKWDQLKATI